MKQPSQLTTVFAADGLKRTLPENGEPNDVLASFSLGFPPRTMATDSTAVPPAGQDINGILNVLSSIIQYLQAGGGYVFSSSFAEAIGGYPIGARVDSSDGKTQWINTLANNKNNPEVSGVGWISDAPAVMEGATANTAGKQGFVPAPSAGDQNKVLTGSGEWKHASGVPVGTVVMFTAAEPPAGYLKCDGAAVGRATCPELFAAIGTTYGEGDGSTTFNLPDSGYKKIDFDTGTTELTAPDNGYIFVKASASLGGFYLRNLTKGYLSESLAERDWGLGAFIPCFKGDQIEISSWQSTINSVFFATSPSAPFCESSNGCLCIKAFDAAVDSGLIDITELANEVAGKADTNLSNLSATGKAKAAHLAMPSNFGVELTIGESGQNYTMPADGFLELVAIASGIGNTNFIPQNSGPGAMLFFPASDVAQKMVIPVRKGEIVKLNYESLNKSAQDTGLYFWYSNGSQP